MVPGYLCFINLNVWCGGLQKFASVVVQFGGILKEYEFF